MSVWERLDVEVPLMVRLFGGLPDWEVDKARTALMIVDMQHYDALPGKGMWTLAHERGMASELNYYYDRLRLATSNLERILRGSREQGVTVIHLNGDVLLGQLIAQRNAERNVGRNRPRPFSMGRRQRSADDAEIVAPLRPLPNEIVIKKQGAGPFGITNVDHVLRQLGIEYLIVGGTVTHQCVEVTVRGAYDYGYKVILLEDGTATISEELQRNTLIALGDWFCKVMTTDEVLDFLTQKKHPSLVTA